MTNTETMRAISQDTYGTPDVLQETLLPKPAPGVSEILVAVHAAGVNPTDWWNRAQSMTVARMPLVLGLFQRRADIDRAARLANQERLRMLNVTHGNEVVIFNSHDPVDYENCRCGRH